MDDLIYLDNGATSYPKPKSVYDFMDRYYREYGVSPGRSGYDKALEAEEVVQGARVMLTELFNGTNSERLTFSYNASDSLNQIIQGTVQRGDHVVTTNLEHNSVLRPLYHLEQDGVIEITYIDFDAAGYVDPDDFRKAIRGNTRLVIMNHASNVIGTVQPAGEVGAICQEAGILFALDCSQSAGQVDIDVQAMHIDMLAFTGHKSLMGPTGIGGMYTAEGVVVRAIRQGGTGVRSAVRTHLEEYPFRLECGTLNVVGVAGLYAGQKWLREEGLAKIHQQELDLWDRLRLGLQEMEGVTTYCADSPENHIGILSFNVEGLEAGDVGMMLDVDHEIAVRTGLQCAPLVHVGIGTYDIHGTSRFGIGPFNTEAHIETAIEAVREIASSR
ncbi:aminotransferase class V-fold PLP-dependent enzyme [Gemmatimonadota bacterium]